MAYRLLFLGVVSILVLLVNGGCSGSNDGVPNCESLCARTDECGPPCVPADCLSYCVDNYSTATLECTSLSSCSTFIKCLCGEVDVDTGGGGLDALSLDAVPQDTTTPMDTIDEDAPADTAADVPGEAGPDTADVVVGPTPLEPLTEECTIGVGAVLDCQLSVPAMTQEEIIEECMQGEASAVCRGACGLTWVWDCEAMNDCVVDCIAGLQADCQGSINISGHVEMSWSAGPLILDLVFTGGANGQTTLELERRPFVEAVENPTFSYTTWMCLGTGYIFARNDANDNGSHDAGEFADQSDPVNIATTDIDGITIVAN